MIVPTFLSLPERSTKPRTVGLTHVLDKGLTVESARSVLAVCGTSHGRVEVRLGHGLRRHRVAREAGAVEGSTGFARCLGGTLLEISWAQGRAQQCLDWAADVGFDSVEVSRGVAAMTPGEKHDLLRRAAAAFVVLSEVGSKDPEQVLTAQQWTR